MTRSSHNIHFHEPGGPGVFTGVAGGKAKGEPVRGLPVGRRETTRYAAKADNRTVRESNEALLLELLRDADAMTRSELASRSMLTKPTVSVIVDRLIRQGTLHESGPGARRARAGPRGRLVAINADAAAFAGIHFGARGTAIALADAKGMVRAAKVVGAYPDAAERAMRDLPQLVIELLRESGIPRKRLRGVGVAVPGLVHHQTGTCLVAPNLGWYNVPIRASLTAALGAPAIVRNSTHAGATAEARLGIGKHARSFVWIYIGSGIGAAVVLGGRVLYGTRGFTGEMGHWRACHDGNPCACGRRGCLETVASNFAIESAANAEWARTHGGAPSAAPLDTRAVAAAALGGDASARKILEGVGEYLGIAISSLLNLLDLEVVVLDGIAIRIGDCLMNTIRSSVTKYAIGGEAIPIVQSRVEHDVMLRGSVLLAMEGARVERPRRAR